MTARRRIRSLGAWNEDTSTGETLAVQTVEQSFRPSDRRVDTVLRYRRGSAAAPAEVVDRVWSLRWYEPGEFELLAERAGLTIERTVDLGAFGPSVTLSRTDC